MYLFANSLTIDTIVCEPTSQYAVQLIAVSCCACERPKLFLTLGLQSTPNRLAQLCPTQLAYRDKNYVTIL